METGGNLNNTIKLANLENPRLVQDSRSYLLQKQREIYIAKFMFIHKQLVTMATRITLGEILTTSLNCPTPKHSSLVQNSCTSLMVT